MANPVKHIGRLKNTGVKVITVFRTLPGESDSALIIQVNQLKDEYHDAIMQMLETDQAQEAFEFGEMLFIRHFPDGRPMLSALQQDGRLQKVSTSNVLMTPTVNAAVPLDQLNVLIAEQKNCAVDELCNFVSGAQANAQAKKTQDSKKNAVPTVKQLLFQQCLRPLLTKFLLTLILLKAIEAKQMLCTKKLPGCVKKQMH